MNRWIGMSGKCFHPLRRFPEGSSGTMQHENKKIGVGGGFRQTTLFCFEQTVLNGVIE
jgi:hypothetical protein